MRTKLMGAVLLVGALLMTGCDASSAAAVPRLAAFDRPATAEDALPDGRQVPLEEYTDLRRIGEVDGALVYAARGPAERPWCIVIALDWPGPDDAMAAGSCADDESFAQRGTGVRMGGGGQRAAATLLPDDFTGQLEDGWEVVGPNLASGTGS